MSNREKLIEKLDKAVKLAEECGCPQCELLLEEYE